VHGQFVHGCMAQQGGEGEIFLTTREDEQNKQLNNVMKF